MGGGEFPSGERRAGSCLNLWDGDNDWLDFLKRASDGSAVVGGFEQLPFGGDIMEGENVHDSVGNGLEGVGGEGKHGGSSAAEADAEETRVSGRSVLVEDGLETRNKSTAVWLVYSVAHGFVEHLGIRWTVA